jgi:hypothetical protein
MIPQSLAIVKPVLESLLSTLSLPKTGISVVIGGTNGRGFRFDVSGSF